MKNMKLNIVSLFRKTTRSTFFIVFSYFSVLRNDRNSAKQLPVLYSFVFREPKKIMKLSTIVLLFNES